MKIVPYHNDKGVEKLKAQQERFSFYVHRSFSLSSSDSTSSSSVIANTTHFNLI